MFKKPGSRHWWWPGQRRRRLAPGQWLGWPQKTPGQRCWTVGSLDNGTENCLFCPSWANSKMYLPLLKTFSQANATLNLLAHDRRTASAPICSFSWKNPNLRPSVRPFVDQALKFIQFLMLNSINKMAQSYVGQSRLIVDYNWKYANVGTSTRTWIKTKLVFFQIHSTWPWSLY